MRITHRAIVVAAALLFVPAMAMAASADKPTVTCKDGTTGPGGRGACRGHGGVDKGAKSGTASAPAAAPAEPAAAPATHAKAAHTEKAAGGKADNSDPTGALAKCKDGTYWHGTHHSGSCSHHGGVEQWMDGSK